MHTNYQTIDEENNDFPTATTSSNTTTNCSPSYMQPVKSELSVNKESDNVVTLVHTVSFYRRQQSANVSLFFIVLHFNVGQLKTCEFVECQFNSDTQNMSRTTSAALRYGKTGC